MSALLLFHLSAGVRVAVRACAFIFCAIAAGVTLYASDPAAIGHHGHAMQFRDFVEAVKKNRPPAIDGHEGRRSVEIILGVYKAAETGKTVKLPLKGDPVLKARTSKAKNKK